MKPPKPNLETFIEECTQGILWAIEIGNEHWAYHYTISLVGAIRKQRDMKPKLKLVK
jgi:hypothetical protein